ncbi:MAG TPA: M23 family metallopeptidase [Geminicoccus sp.]|uniref:M23 family metallopeptidase n=1 Tax=Geminicoccus sp. TaxID=2024832 RepID=UPI002C799FD2|nr:M23 family metallopeptidase [Geminicoccus sp.]HWL71190.1 M23 family metallopeptidase [Geminicoccus sp.]
MRRLAFLAALLPLTVGRPATALELDLPIACTPGTDCWIVHYVDHDPGPAVADSFCGPMSYDGHDGIDFAVRDGAAMRAGVEVLAAADGVVARVRDGVRDVAVEQGGKEQVADINCGNGMVVEHADGWETQYCHLREGSVTVQPGDTVRAGQKLGLVGLSGMTSFPHLHLSVRKDGQKLDPFHATPPEEACTVSGTSLWSPDAVERIGAYQPLALSVLGIADGPVTSEAVWDGRAEAALLTSDSPAVVAFLGGYALRQGDRITLTLTDPNGGEVVRHEQDQARDQARTMLFAGRKRPPEGWPAGSWTARAEVVRDGQTYHLERRFEIAP